MDTKKSKWYENKGLIILLFFIFPPVGIYAMAKLKTDTWKKLVYIIPAVLYTFFISMLLLGIIIASNIDHYKDGVDYLNKGNFELALENLSKVETDNPNYQNAQSKIKEIESKLLKKKIEKEKENEKSINKLKEFQNFWADSILKSESEVGNRHFVAHKLNLPDTIIFEYTEGVTKNGFGVNFKNDTLFYRNFYKEQLTKKYPNEFNHIKTFISFIPNRNIDYDKIVAENNAKFERKEKILRQFSTWDGSHSALKRLVKDNMNDPGSFNHVETTYSDKGSYILVQMKYRGKNGFGAKVLEMVTAKVDIEGNIISIKK